MLLSTTGPDPTHPHIDGLKIRLAGFIVVWLLILPFGISNTAVSVLSSKTLGSAILLTWVQGACLFLLSMMMLSVDEVANQLEDPFLSLPLFDTMKTALGHLYVCQPAIFAPRPRCLTTP